MNVNMKYFRNDEDGNPVKGHGGYCPPYCGLPIFGG